VRLLDQGRSYVEIPVTAQERQAGTSSALRLRNILSVAHTLLDLLIRRVGRRMRGQPRQLASAREVSRPDSAEPAR
jgi:hypothetical protein